MSPVKRLSELFAWSRRGSLAKEEGGMGPLAFPFSRRNFGSRRSEVRGRRESEVRVAGAIPPTGHRDLVALAQQIPPSFRGLAVEGPDVLRHYVLTRTDLLVEPTIEPSRLKRDPMFLSRRKTAWTPAHEDAVRELMSDAAIAAFVARFRTETRLSPRVLSEQRLWIGLREPAAGELIIPRKLRSGHRVHVSPFAFRGEHVRLSSNFCTFVRCTAVDAASGLDRETATRLIAAWLVSSFGQLEFERRGYDREGCLSLELAHMKEVVVFDPRHIAPAVRPALLAAFSSVPFPVATIQRPQDDPARCELDRLLAHEVVRFHPEWKPQELLGEVHAKLDELLEQRRN